MNEINTEPKTNRIANGKEVGSSDLLSGKLPEGLLFKIIAGTPPKTYKIFTHGATEGFGKPVLIVNPTFRRFGIAN